MRERTVLVLDGASGPALAATRSLGRGGWRVLTIAGTRSARSRYAAADVSIPDAADDAAGFVAAVVATCELERPDLVAPATDASVALLWEHVDALGGARILGADRASYERSVDKAKALEAADAAGFGTPEWVAPASLEDARDAFRQIGSPCVVKPRQSYACAGTRLVHRRHSFVEREDQLERELLRQSEPDGSLPVLQAFVEGRALAVTAVVRDGEVLALAARETLSFDPIAGGTSVWKRTVPPGDAGVAASVELLRSLEYEGLAEVEYQVERGAERERLMEIGVRLHGWVPLAMAAGVDLPLIAAQALMGDPLLASQSYRSGVEMRWPAGELRRIRAALRPRPNLPPGVTRRSVLAKAWPPWRPGMHYDGFVLDDPEPWIPLRRRRDERAAT